MNRKEGTKHRKRKSNKLKILFWAILFAFVSVLILYLFSLGGENGIAEILNMRDYWLSVGVANGLILIGYLMMYRVDAQNIALNENDLEDTEWLSVKRLKKLKEFQVYDYKAADSKQDGIVIGAEKKGGNGNRLFARAVLIEAGYRYVVQRQFLRRAVEHIQRKRAIL